MKKKLFGNLQVHLDSHVIARTVSPRAMHQSKEALKAPEGAVLILLLLEEEMLELIRPLSPPLWWGRKEAVLAKLRPVLPHPQPEGWGRRLNLSWQDKKLCHTSGLQGQVAAIHDGTTSPA